jgi:hypothetical protein
VGLSRALGGKILAHLGGGKRERDEPVASGSGNRLMARCGWQSRPASGLDAGFVNGAGDLLFGLSKLLLEASHQLVFVALAVGKIVVGQIAVRLLEFAFNDIPIPLDLQFIHTSASHQTSATDAFRPAKFPFTPESSGEISEDSTRPLGKGGARKRRAPRYGVDEDADEFDSFTEARGVN